MSSEFRQIKKKIVAVALAAALFLLYGVPLTPAWANTAKTRGNIHTAQAMGTEDSDPWAEGLWDEDLWGAEQTSDVLLGEPVTNVDVNAFDYAKNGSYNEMLMEAARVTGMNPCVMAAMILQEMGKEGSSPLVTGEGVNGKYRGIYNFINYQAYADGSMSAKERGLWWASGEGTGRIEYGRPWNSPERAILRGMGIMSANYVLKGQETYYFKKFDVNPRSWKGDAEHSPHWNKKDGAYSPSHQYMSNVEAAKSEGTILGSFYQKSGIEKEELTFLIPVYENMPEDPSPEPGKEPVPVAAWSGEAADDAAKKILEDFSDTAGYADLLLSLHEKHPSWSFVKVEVPASYDDADTTWDALVTAEMGDGLNLADPKYHGEEYIRGIVERDSGGWLDASREAVAYFMDPRNFLTDTAAVYQFVTHGYDPEADTYVTMDALSLMTEGTFLGRDVIRAELTEEKSSEEESSEEEISEEEDPEEESTGTESYAEKESPAEKSSEEKSSGSSGSGSGHSGGGGSSSGGGGGSSGGGGGSSGGGGGSPSVRKTAPTAGSATFSDKWFQDAAGIWRIRDGRGNVVKSAWLCDDAVAANGQNVWYLLNTDGTMLAAGLVQDNTGNYYSLETQHNGYFGMLRYVDGIYDGIYMEFSKNHDGTFGALKNQSAIDALKARYGVTKFAIGNENCVYSKNL